MDSLGVICARSKSRRVPQKALQIVGTTSLLDYAIASAKQSSRLTRWMVASDLSGFNMPAEIADGPIIGALQWAINESPPADVVVTLQACIPFRRGYYIDQTLDLIQRFGFESVQTVVNVGWDHAPIYKPNGAVYATRVELVRQGRLWGGVKHGMILMTPEESVNIDTEYDLRVARALCALSS